MDRKIFGPVRLKPGPLDRTEEEAQADEAAPADRAHAVIGLLHAICWCLFSFYSVERKWKERQKRDYHIITAPSHDY